MSDYLEDLKDASRLLMEVPLQPLQGTRFQPTGFPDLGAAVYQTDEGQNLLVESAQSMANRMESVCWDDANHQLIKPLSGLPYVGVEQDGDFLTSSVLEAHRLNSSYILNDDVFKDTLMTELKADKKAPLDFRRIAEVLVKYDCNSLLHGVFLEKVDGRMAIPRALSSFIEATGVRVATSGGVKKDHIDPTGGAEKRQAEGRARGSEEGFGHIPYTREEYTANTITAYFNIDLSQLRAYGLPECAENLLTTLALYKIRLFLRDGLRLRTACDLETIDEMKVKRPEGFSLPDIETLETDVTAMVGQCADEGLFADPPVTTTNFSG